MQLNFFAFPLLFFKNSSKIKLSIKGLDYYRKIQIASTLGFDQDTAGLPRNEKASVRLSTVYGYTASAYRSALEKRSLTSGTPRATALTWRMRTSNIINKKNYKYFFTPLLY